MQTLLQRKHIFIMVTLLAVVALAITTLASSAAAIDSSLTGFKITTGPPPTSEFSSGSLIEPPVDALEPGEILVGKSIVYNDDSSLLTPDGTITVTLSAWASSFGGDAARPLTQPLLQMANGAYLTVTDDLDEFVLAEPLPAGLSLNNGIVTWNITDQSAVLGSAPLTISYTLTVADPSNQPYLMNYWYSTGAAQAQFEPHHENPYYYTMEETTYFEFDMSMNWNNGTGLNTGAIIDNDLGITVVFPKNISGQNELAYNSDGTMNATTAHWNWWPQNASTRNQAATVVNQAGVTQYYSWHLQWLQMSGRKSYFFTVKDLLGPGVDLRYEAILDGGGGSGSMAGGKTTISQDYFQRVFNSSQDDPFFWEGDLIVRELDVIGQIKLNDVTVILPTFQMTVNKAFAAGSLHVHWGVDDAYLFTFYMRDVTTDLYVVFDDNGDGTYTFNGYSSRMIALPFSVNQSAVLLNVPTESFTGDPADYEIYEYPSWAGEYARPPRVEVSYSLDSFESSSTAFFTPEADSQSVLTVTNNYTSQPVATLRLLKLFDGFPEERGITAAQEFEVKIWDAANSNYLLFVKPDAQALASGSGWDSSYWSPGTLFVVGNDGGTSEAWNFSDSYWENRSASDPSLVFDTISLYELSAVGITNIWPANYEVHELDFEGGLLDDSSANDWWQYYVNFRSLLRIQEPSAGTAQDPNYLWPGGSYLAMITNYFQDVEEIDPGPIPDPSPDPDPDPDPNPDPDPDPSPSPEPPTPPVPPSPTPPGPSPGTGGGGSTDGGGNGSGNGGSNDGGNGDSSDSDEGNFVRTVTDGPETGDLNRMFFWTALMKGTALLIFAAVAMLIKEKRLVTNTSAKTARK